MFKLLKPLLKVSSYPLFSNRYCKNDLFYALVVIFNLVSKSRIKLVGPDRACAEWLMRNGATIRWKDSKDYVTHYDGLPLDPDNHGQYLLKEVDATDAAISYHGFPHFEGCKHVDKIKFVKCYYIEDKAIGMLDYVKSSLEDLEIRLCPGVSDNGIKSLKKLENLKKLKLGTLDKVSDMNGAVDELRKALPDCEITIQETVALER